MTWFLMWILAMLSACPMWTEMIVAYEDSGARRRQVIVSWRS